MSRLYFWLFFQGCFPTISEFEANQFPDNPNHDYDGDNLFDAEDCDDSDPTIGLKQYFYRDADGDGFGVENDFIFDCVQNVPNGYVPTKYFGDVAVFDCNDLEYYVNPFRFETCDGLDNDCDGIIDEYDNQEDAFVWYLDADGDGFGDPNRTERACLQPENYVANPRDCDDLHALSNPDGIEVCDDEGRDENCNGVVNEASADDAPFWYRDSDEDGFGNILINQRACEEPEGFVSDNTDCDDINALSNPQEVEICDQIDNNCDGLVDEAQAVDVMTYYRDADGDGFGSSLLQVSVCPMHKPIGYIVNNTDCNDDNAMIYPNADEYCNTFDDDCDGQVDEGSGSDAPINSLVWYLDGDGDGFGDSASMVIQCEKPFGYELNDLDCNDTDGNIHPSADELCTPNIDENCDGDTTYLVPAMLLNTWYPDSDGDGYGNPDFIIRMCEQPLNYVDNPDDCNDTDFWVHPEDDGLHVDASGQPIDHRELCNGKVDLCENDILGDLTPLDDEIDGDGDGFVECTLDVDPLQWADLSHEVIGGDDCDDTRSYRYPRAPELCNGLYDRCEDLIQFGGEPPFEVD